MRTLIFCAVAALSTPAFAECSFVNAGGDRLAAIESTDHDFRYERAGGAATLCAISRTPEQTSGFCDDGTDTAYFLAPSPLGGGEHLLSFDFSVWRQDCP